jgi:hypothetical protein
MTEYAGALQGLRLARSDRQNQVESDRRLQHMGHLEAMETRRADIMDANARHSRDMESKRYNLENNRYELAKKQSELDAKLKNSQLALNEARLNSFKHKFNVTKEESEHAKQMREDKKFATLFPSHKSRMIFDVYHSGRDANDILKEYRNKTAKDITGISINPDGGFTVTNSAGERKVFTKGQAYAIMSLETQRRKEESDAAKALRRQFNGKIRQEKTPAEVPGHAIAAGIRNGYDMPELHLKDKSGKYIMDKNGKAILNPAAKGYVDSFTALRQQNPNASDDDIAKRAARMQGIIHASQYEATAKKKSDELKKHPFRNLNWYEWLSPTVAGIELFKAWNGNSPEVNQLSKKAQRLRKDQIQRRGPLNGQGESGEVRQALKWLEANPNHKSAPKVRAALENLKKQNQA